MRHALPSLALLTLLVLPAAAQEAYLHHRLDATLVVADPAQAAERIAELVEARGGYFVSMAPDLITARLPNEALPALRVFLEDLALEVRAMTPAAQDLREAWVAAQAALRSREEILARNLQYLTQADVTGTLAIEREVTALMTEIEALKGRLRKVDADRRYARVEVRLAFLEVTLPRDVSSSFPWLDTVDFYEFVRGVFR